MAYKLTAIDLEGNIVSERTSETLASVKAHVEYHLKNGDTVHCVPGELEDENMSNQDYTEQHSMPPWSESTSIKSQLAEIAELKKQHSHATQAMFTEFVRMYREIQSMKINPEWLSRTWKI